MPVVLSFLSQALKNASRFVTQYSGVRFLAPNEPELTILRRFFKRQYFIASGRYRRPLWQRKDLSLLVTGKSIGIRYAKPRSSLTKLVGET
jgi:hypothetical protein